MHPLSPPHQSLILFSILFLEEDLGHLEPNATHFDLIVDLKLDIVTLELPADLVGAPLVIFSHKHHGLLHLAVAEFWVTRLMVVLVHVLIQLNPLDLELCPIIFEVHQDLVISKLGSSIFIVFDQMYPQLLGY